MPPRIWAPRCPSIARRRSPRPGEQTARLSSHHLTYVTCLTACGQRGSVRAVGPAPTSAKQNSENRNRYVRDGERDETGGVNREHCAVRTERPAAKFSKEAGQTWYDEQYIEKKNETCEQRRQIAMGTTDVDSRHDPAADRPRR